ncbi:MAG: radical SAM family heme chaperone HemW [Phycisphaeraceae bacterium]|nr:radical SAM family heme chaperone HemW [Phycisphaeraceae bacterium]
MNGPVGITVSGSGRGDGSLGWTSARAAVAGGHGPVRSLYVHTPFCVHKCHYCDFYSFVDQRDQQGAFVERLIEELRAQAPLASGAPLRTIFVGGGTPSLLREDVWRRLLSEMNGLFDLSLIRSGAGEFTVECNPESATAELLGVLRAGGVNRVSMGAQSFEARHLRTLERRHDPERVAEALDLAARAGVERRSIDLIYAVPGQTLAEWEADVRRALALGTTHLSCYNLTYEPNTAMTVRLKRGEFTPVDDDLEADMFELAGALLAERGLERYEVSNYALGGIRGGQACAHNLAYWRQESWLAAGPSASGHVWAGPDRRAGGHRWKNAPNLGAYLAQSDGGYAPVAEHEAPDRARAVRERIMTGVRLSEGLDAAEVMADAEAAEPGSGTRLAAAAAELEADGWLASASGRWRVTARGWLGADFVARKLMGCVGVA